MNNCRNYIGNAFRSKVLSYRSEDCTAIRHTCYLFATAAIIFLQGCTASTTANLYPVQGPLSQSKTPVVIVAKVEGITGGTGPFELSMPNGVVCKGKWSSVAPTYSESTNVSLLTRYGSVTGTGNTTGLLPGANKGQAFANCSDGNSVNAEFITGSGTANGYGVAEDKRGNVFKLLF